MTDKPSPPSPWFARLRDRLCFLFTLESAILWAGLAAVVAMFAWASVRGFDISDEGAYYLESWYPRDSDNSHTLYHWFGHFGLLLTGGRIWLYRLFTLALHFAAACVLLRGAWLWSCDAVVCAVETRSSAFALWTPVVLVWSLLGFTFVPVALSYNTVNALFLCAWLGAWLAFRSPSLPDRSRVRWLVAAWVCLAGSMVTKASTGVLIGGFSVIGTAGWLLRNKCRVNVLQWVLLGVGFAAFVTVCLIRPYTEPDVVAWYHATPGDTTLGRFLQTIRSYATTSGFGVTCRRLFWESRDLFLAALPMLWIPLPLAAIAALCKSTGSRWQKTLGNSSWWGGAALAMFAADAMHRAAAAAVEPEKGHFIGCTRFAPIALAFVLLAALIALPALLSKKTAPEPENEPPHSMSDRLFDLVIITATPVLGWFGSGNPIFYNTLFQIAPWMVLLLFIFARTRTVESDGPPRPLIPAMMLALAAFFLFQGVIERPYRGFVPLTKHRKEIKIGPKKESHLVEEQTGQFINRLKSILKTGGFRYGQPILAFYNMPGVVFAVGGRSPGHSWYFGHGTHPSTVIDSAEIDRMRLISVPPDVLKSCFILQEEGEDYFKGALRERGVAFPDDFVLVDKLHRPDFLALGEKDVFVWRPKNVQPAH